MHTHTHTQIVSTIGIKVKFVFLPAGNWGHVHTNVHKSENACMLALLWASSSTLCGHIGGLEQLSKQSDLN